MRIGYSVEGSLDRALIAGLKQRWCPGAELVEGRFRGQTRTSRHREIPKICAELSQKDCRLILFLTDSNDAEWRGVLKDEEARCPADFHHLTLFGVCCRNSESWLSADADHIANHFQRNSAEFRIDDPKSTVEACFGITRSEKKEDEIANFVAIAPLNVWVARNPSFKDFYERVRQASKRLGCQIENLL